MGEQVGEVLHEVIGVVVAERSRVKPHQAAVHIGVPAHLTLSSGADWYASDE